MNGEQKVAVITGASQGIGAALVKAYRDRGYRVIATARSIRPTSDDQVIAGQARHRRRRDLRRRRAGDRGLRDAGAAVAAAGIAGKLDWSRRAVRRDDRDQLDELAARS